MVCTFASDRGAVTFPIVPVYNWPTRRGFDEVYGTLDGAGSFYQPHSLMSGETLADQSQDGFYYTDAITEHVIGFIAQHHERSPDTPLFLYLAYTAPHWPLHAHPQDIARYRGRFDAGWDELRRKRLERLVDQGILKAEWPLSDRDARVIDPIGMARGEVDGLGEVVELPPVVVVVGTGMVIGDGLPAVAIDRPVPAHLEVLPAAATRRMRIGERVAHRHPVHRQLGHAAHRLGALVPVASQMVGAMSTIWWNCGRFAPAAVCPGQLMINGTRTPPANACFCRIGPGSFRPWAHPDG